MRKGAQGDNGRLLPDQQQSPSYLVEVKNGAPGPVFSSKILSAESQIVRRFGPMTIQNMSSLKSEFHFTFL